MCLVQYLPLASISVLPEALFIYVLMTDSCFHGEEVSF